MKIKIMNVVVFIICISVIFSGCSYIAYKDYYSNVDTYEKIWELSGLSQQYKNSTKLFPEDIDILNVSNYYCRYDQQLPLGEAFQVLLEIRYDERKIFESELSRIVSLAYSCDNYFENNDLYAYATLLEEETYYEYALVDDEKQTIYYIYLQNIPREQIEIESTLLPKE